MNLSRIYKRARNLRLIMKRLYSKKERKKLDSFFAPSNRSVLIIRNKNIMDVLIINYRNICVTNANEKKTFWGNKGDGR